MGLLKILIRFQAFWEPHRGELPHVKIFMNYDANPLTRDSILLTY